jgi:hypothetical protein
MAGRDYPGPAFPFHSPFMPPIKRTHLLFLLWLAASLFWAGRCAQDSGFITALQTYSTVMDLGNQIADGEATSYQKHLYRTYGPRLEYANGEIMIFLATGVGVPLVVLFLGRWLFLRKPPSEKPLKRKKPL